MTEVSELREELKTIHAAMAPAPWSVVALSAAVRHVQRNTDVMEDAQEYADEPDKSANIPDRYDGEPLARLRNLLPRILSALEGGQ